MTPDVAKAIFVFALVVWGVLRYPHQHRASKIPVRNTARNLIDSARIACATLGLGIVPLIYVATGFPRFASYEFIKGFAYAGALVFALGLWLFYLAHKDLGRNFSVSLDVREGHVLISKGVYAVIRHPMYSAFWLWAIAQVLVTGPANGVETHESIAERINFHMTFRAARITRMFLDQLPNCQTFGLRFVFG